MAELQKAMDHELCYAYRWLGLNINALFLPRNDHVYLLERQRKRQQGRLTYTLNLGGQWSRCVRSHRCNICHDR